MSKQVFFFSENQLQYTEISKTLLGNKGANLVEMSCIGVPVPPGFILSTEVCKTNFIDENSIFEQIQNLEQATNKKFGSNVNPLLVSVRSGAIVSMPGMMDTVLNIGLNDEVVNGLAAACNNKVFAYDSYRRLLQMYGSVVMGVNDDVFHSILSRYSDIQSVQILQEIIEQFKQVILQESGKAFPQDVMQQLITSIQAVFDSWHSSRARVYRERNGIDHNLATAATVQTMVFGNMSENSCTGVLFTRNPISGEKTLFGEFLPNAQGEDVVAGFVNTYPLTLVDAKRNYLNEALSMEMSRPQVFDELQGIANKLEKHFGDMQDIEFTVEEGKLWILQTRSGKRSSAAAIKIAVDMVNEGFKTEEEAIKLIPITAIEQSIHKQLVIKIDSRVITKGLAASPGAASGVIALTPQRAEILSKSHSVILIRNETSPEDIAGMYSSEGILTARGGVTSHAAVVARGIGKPCICSAQNIVISDESVSINGHILYEGDYITINGSTGEVFDGHMETSPSEISDDFMRVLSWMSKYQKISVLGNAETPEDVKTAMMFGAEGIGLCRTEHMFFSSDRINDVRRMILSESEENRVDILKKLGEYQRSDFLQLFHILQGKPICIRLLDPPLHEFLPQTDDDVQVFCDHNQLNFVDIKNVIKSLHEYNPMLGHRGARLGITHTDIYQCQAQAIFDAMLDYEKESGIQANVEIMIPLVFSENELYLLKIAIENIKRNFEKQNNYALNYKFGVMIELPRAALIADKLANHVDFISFGTNDLTQTTFGVSRDDSSKFLSEYMRANILLKDPFSSIDRDGVGELIKVALRKIRIHHSHIKTGVCGEHGGDEESIKFFREIGMNYVSCSPYRVPAAKLSASTV